MNQAFKFRDRTRYIINTDRDGQPSQSGQVHSSPEQLQSVIANILDFFAHQDNQNTPPRLLFYCHGGLVDEARALQIMQRQYRNYLQNNIYPVFFIWESGFFDILEDVGNSLVSEIFDPVAPQHTRFFSHIFRGEGPLDETIEELAKGFSGGWSACKERASRVFGDGGFGWQFLTQLLTALRSRNLHPEFHVVGHSAGALVLGELLRNLRTHRIDLPIRTCSLYAPACSLAYFDDTYIPEITAPTQRIAEFYLYTLTDDEEKADACIPVRFYRYTLFSIYRKSLLYLISRGLEGAAEDVPLLGMERYAVESANLAHIWAAARGAHVTSGTDVTCTSAVDACTLHLSFSQHTHGGFGETAQVLSSTLKTIRREDALTYPF
ncbi:hypothetical protein OS242_14580 [Tumebacillus sp. DT12]|uniref:Fungal lipase-like domain-containing protein n=1 Tax=Tumebacillus lacus TaxID=2995335 RepID=A0ABT3X2P5_9BACL|nr:hypothetical protein [Tumebacillus lacus]MCX7571175.1 hypothetical protein [Tumebacillus lacus]